MNINKYDISSYQHGRSHKKILFGVNHFVSAKNVPGYNDNPYDMQTILYDVFKKLGEQYKFSCHFVISREGEIWQMVDIKDTAWHAGKSVIAIPTYYTNLNALSVGVEWVCKEGDTYTDAQYKAGGWLANYIEEKVKFFNLGTFIHWVGHDWISGTIAVKLGIRSSKSKKVDPGPTFDWGKFHVYRQNTSLAKLVNLEVIRRKPQLKKEIFNELSLMSIIKLYWNNKGRKNV